MHCKSGAKLFSCKEKGMKVKREQQVFDKSSFKRLARKNSLFNALQQGLKLINQVRCQSPMPRLLY